MPKFFVKNEIKSDFEIRKLISMFDNFCEKMNLDELGPSNTTYIFEQHFKCQSVYNETGFIGLNFEEESHLTYFLLNII